MKIAFPALTLIVLSGCAQWPTDAPEPIDQADSIYNSRLRGDMASDILGRPTNVNRPMDAELAERLFSQKPPKTSHVDIPPALPGVRVYAPGELTLKMAITAIERTIGYTSVFSPVVDAKFPVTMPDKMMSLEQFIDLIEGQTNVIINVFPEARTLMVLPE